MPDNAYPWYEVTESADLEQGDFIEKCPIFVFPPEAADEAWDGTLQRSFNDAILLTQSCDLVLNRGRQPIDTVVVCPIYSKTALDNSSSSVFGSRDRWNLVIKEHVIGWRALPDCPLLDFPRELSAVDLRRFRTLPLALVLRLASSKKRLRLRSPYRENIAQAFGQQFTRVALPSDISRL